jgi:hypothetical protein
VTFPNVVNSATTNTTGGSTTVTMPASIVPGNLLLLVLGDNIASGSPSISSGWTSVGSTNVSTFLFVNVWAKVAAGGDTATITLPASSPGGVIVYQISGWSGTIADIGYAGASGGSPVNPPALTMTAGSQDYLWFAVAMAGGVASQPTGAPANYTNLTTFGSASGYVATAQRDLTASSEDPGAFTGGSGSATIGATIAVAPSVSFGPGPATVDSSSPPMTSAPLAASVTTSAFDPPACLLLACCGDEETATNSFSISNNGTALTWTQIGTTENTGGAAALFWAHLPTARTGMTVTLTCTQNLPQLAVYCITGVVSTPNPPIGGHQQGSSTSTNFNTTAFTTSGTTSLGFVVAAQSITTGNCTSSDCTYQNVGTVMAGYKYLGTAGSSATFNVTCSNSSAHVDWCSCEVLSAAGTVPSLPRVVQVVTGAIKRAAYF